MLNATRPRAECYGCARAQAQVGLDGGEARRAGDFSYAVLRGSVAVRDVVVCYFTTT